MQESWLGETRQQVITFVVRMAIVPAIMVLLGGRISSQTQRSPLEGQGGHVRCAAPVSMPEAVDRR